jgi:hypothetical protein
MSRTTLRPCLKHSTDPDPPASASPNNSSPFPFALSASVHGPRVHFPPAPSLCQTHLTHSASIYDRAPIVVPPHACALPARNERTYTPSSECLSSKKRRSAQAAGATLHPHAFADAQQAQAHAAAASASVDPTHRMPPLVPDLSSSESDESDVNSTPLIPNLFPSTAHPPISFVNGTSDAAAAFSFLPHANEREKPRKERSHRSRSHGSPRMVRTSEFAVPELDGCLGGF